MVGLQQLPAGQPFQQVTVTDMASKMAAAFCVYIEKNAVLSYGNQFPQFFHFKISIERFYSPKIVYISLKRVTILLCEI